MISLDDTRPTSHSGPTQGLAQGEEWQEPKTRCMMSSSAADRAAGLMLGLAVGDDNGGPIQMALCLAESLRDKSCYDGADVFSRYYAWWSSDGENAWDTGPTAKDVFVLVAQKCPDCASGNFPLEKIKEAARVVHERHRGMTAGVNAVHRVAPLALAGFVTFDELVLCAEAESRMTHLHNLSLASCVAIVQICRHLVSGRGWEVSIRDVASSMTTRGTEDCRTVSAALLCGLDIGRGSSNSKLSPGGFCPDVLTAAVCFVTRAEGSFDTGMLLSKKFAGASNYCPVLVGALLGAQVGACVLQASRAGRRLDKIHSVAQRCRAVAEGLAPTLEVVVPA